MLVSNGTATFAVRSSAVGTATITAALTGKYSGAGTVDIVFQRHKVVVQMLGIRTNLQCAGTSDTCVSDGSDLYPSIRDVATSADNYAPSDFLWYSYLGGKANSKTGDWTPNSYACADTAENYTTAISRLVLMLVGYARVNPNTDFTIIGHSQGGLLGLQMLGFLQRLPSDSKVSSIITLDSPLGGVPKAGVDVAAQTCWNGPANEQLVNLYNSNTVGDPVGDNATILCALITSCAEAPGTTNQQATLSAAISGTDVYTFGNLDDALYTPASCNLLNLYAVPASQVLSAGHPTLDNLGGNYGADYLTCLSNSHSQVVGAELPQIVAPLGQQDT